MSLDVYLEVDEPIIREGSGIFVREGGAMKEITRAEWDYRNPGHEPLIAEAAPETREVFWMNITHNLGKMASEAGLYAYLWRPDENGAATARRLSARRGSSKNIGRSGAMMQRGFWPSCPNERRPMATSAQCLEAQQ